jgi:hypothetical protein
VRELNDLRAHEQSKHSAIGSSASTNDPAKSKTKCHNKRRKTASLWGWTESWRQEMLNSKMPFPLSMR